MSDGRNVLTIIPARGGSKGVLRKNIRLLAGKPLIAWTIETAKACAFLHRIVVTTDDEETADIAVQYGAEVPFLRPESLSGDDAKIVDVVSHTIEWYRAKGENFDLILLLQPTSPLRTKDDIEASFKLLAEKNAKSIISVCNAEHHPFWTNTLPPNRCMKKFLNTKALNANRQELPVYYRLNGSIYLAFADYLEQQEGFWGNLTYAYVMPIERSVDIDTEFDFKMAEYQLTHR
ncbi:MAG: CMP-N-acetlyneuraminic acid synthetase [Desulfobacterales bacterium SG8_35_2]|nr:MAG: CMP-N-acetlyneuraminic acid synthetase [Desulfobacterales bacterium SG8_35_2]